jgi:pimeloyl-ACP methyl ester carboxylesterase
MQNDPPSENIPNTPDLASERVVEPTYTEYAQPREPDYRPSQAGYPPAPSEQPVYPVQAFGAPPMPGMQQPYNPVMSGMQQTYNNVIPGMQQPYNPVIPGTPISPPYVPPTPPLGYPPPAFPPGYPPPHQPGYIPPILPPKSPQSRKPWDVWAIVSIALVLVLLLAGVVTGIAVLVHQKATTANLAPTVCTGSLSSCGTQTTGNTTQPVPTSAFQTAPCPFTVGAGLTEGRQVSCGYVTVPENHSVSGAKSVGSEKTVKLALAIFKGLQYMNSADPNPVLRLDGGPGGPSLDNLAKYVTFADYNDFIFDHDVVMFDQRGTGYSTPSLKCPELISLQTSSASASSQTYEDAARQCHNRLVSQGVNLNDFNSIQNAGDVSDVIHALGYKQMTVYGVSYGTRLALTVMRLYPSVVHSAILDSTYPTNHNRNDLPSDAQRVFDVLFQGCAKDSNCNTKYPDLENVFYNLVDALNAQPISFNTIDQETGNQYTVPFAGDDLISFLFSTFYVTGLIPELPHLIYQIQARDYTRLSYLYGILEFDSTFSDGMFYSTTCSEDWAFLTKQDIAKSEQGIEPHVAKVFGEEDEQQEYSVCQFWNVQAVPSVQKKSVSSDLPTLILAGEYDPITPPSNGQEVEKNLSHSYFFLFPGQGHGQEYSSSCSNEIISAFEDNASQKPSGACINQMTEPAFV